VGITCIVAFRCGSLVWGVFDIFDFLFVLARLSREEGFLDTPLRQDPFTVPELFDQNRTPERLERGGQEAEISRMKTIEIVYR
jgi:hypothetical protein